MPIRSEDDDERFLKAVEERLGWTLGPGHQAEALRRRRRGDTAEAVADEFESLALARRALNDPDAPLLPPPTRPDDDDPQHFPKPDPH